MAGMRRGGGASWRECMTLARGMHAGFALIQGLGYQIYPSGKVRLGKCPAWLLALMLWLMSRIKSFRVLLASGQEEARAMVDVMVAAGAQVNLPLRVAAIQAMRP